MYLSEAAAAAASGTPWVTAFIPGRNRARSMARVVLSTLARTYSELDVTKRYCKLICREPPVSTISRPTDQGPATVGSSKEYLA
jgi:hypothetical protein